MILLHSCSAEQIMAATFFWVLFLGKIHFIADKNNFSLHCVLFRGISNSVSLPKEFISLWSCCCQNCGKNWLKIMDFCLTSPTLNHAHNWTNFRSGCSEPFWASKDEDCITPLGDLCQCHYNLCHYNIFSLLHSLHSSYVPYCSLIFFLLLFLWLNT